MIRVRIRPTPHTMKTCGRPSPAAAKDMLAGRRAWPVWWSERGDQNPIPSRTRPLTAPAPMVLCLKTRESRSPPDLPSTYIPSSRSKHNEARPAHAGRASLCLGQAFRASRYRFRGSACARLSCVRLWAVCIAGADPDLTSAPGGGRLLRPQFGTPLASAARGVVESSAASVDPMEAVRRPQSCPASSCRSRSRRGAREAGRRVAVMRLTLRPRCTAGREKIWSAQRTTLR